MQVNKKFVAVFALLLAGCASHDASQPSQYAPSQVIFIGDLGQYIAVSPVEITYPPSGLMHVVVPLKTTADLDLSVDYRITYFDENHSPVDEATPWQTKTLQAGMTETIEATSASPRARDFQVELRSTKS